MKKDIDSSKDKDKRKKENKKEREKRTNKKHIFLLWLFCYPSVE